MTNIHNGDCMDVMKQMSDESVSCIITDPPYGVCFKNDFYDDTTENVLKNMPDWFSQWFRLLKTNSYLFVFVGVKTIHQWVQAGVDAGFVFKNIIATRSFNNGAPTPKNNFGFQFQPILVFSKGRGKNFNEVDFIPTSQEWLKDKRNKNPKPYTYSYPNWIKTEWGFASAIKKIHPNEKNTDLIKFLIELSTNENDVVFDSFMGSGSTGIACIKSNRDFIGVELDEKMFEVAKERIKSQMNNLWGVK